MAEYMKVCQAHLVISRKYIEYVAHPSKMAEYMKVCQAHLVISRKYIEYVAHRCVFHDHITSHHDVLVFSSSNVTKTSVITGS